MKKINKQELKEKILRILDIAPYLHKSPEEMFKALNVKSPSNPEYPLNAVKIAIEELKEERLVEEEFEWDNEDAEKEK